MNKIILIGGAPTVGKSSTAEKIAKDLKLPWMSTDIIRDMMRPLVNKKDYPALFTYFGMSATQYLSKLSVKEIIKDQRDENQEVWKGVRALIDSEGTYVWESFLIEGIAIEPSLASRLMKNDKRIKVIFLHCDDEAVIRKAIFERGLYDDPEKYPDQLKEKEVEWASLFNEWIKKEAKKYRLPLIEVKDRTSHIKKIKSMI